MNEFYDEELYLNNRDVKNLIGWHAEAVRKEHFDEARTTRDILYDKLFVKYLCNLDRRNLVGDNPCCCDFERGATDAELESIVDFLELLMKESIVSMFDDKNKKEEA